MATLFQRFQVYSGNPDSVEFPKNRIKIIGQFLARLYDRKNNPPVDYIESKEGEQTFKVRDYPEWFIPIMDKWIMINHRNLKHGDPLPFKKFPVRKPTLGELFLQKKSLNAL